MPGADVFVHGAALPALPGDQPKPAPETVPTDEPAADSAKDELQDSRVAPIPKKIK